MAAIGLFFGTQTGQTEMIAEQIQGALGKGNVDLVDVAKASPEDLSAYSYLILGCPTWNSGELQADWDSFLPELDDLDLSGKTVACFGLGDQIGYADYFLDAMGMIAEKVLERGGTLVGQWSLDGYDFSESKAVMDGKFVGLAIDEDNQSDLTASRIQAWAQQLKPAFGLA